MSRTLRIKEMPTTEQPQYRAHNVGTMALSNAELIQIVTQAKYMETGVELYGKAGSLANLSKMSISEMTETDEIGQTSAIIIKAAFELGRRLNLEQALSNFQISCPGDAANVLMMEYGNKEQEHFVVMILDNKNRVLSIETIYIGTVNEMTIRVCEIFKPAIRRGAVAIVIAHNHPSGDPAPSPEDVMTTRQIVEAGQLLGIDVLDHIVVGHNRWVSLKERGPGFRN
jgi:DNA repair protein RadC